MRINDLDRRRHAPVARQQMNENGTQIFMINADVFAFYLRHLR
jgi:hypothetical protein